MERLRQTDIHRFSSEYRRAAKLLKADFPRAERFAPWLLWLLALRRDVHFSAFYDGARDVAFAYYVKREDMLWLLYLAVDPKAQSMGYGTEILRHLREDNPGAQLVLDMEYPDPDSKNYVQQLARERFYARAGITDAGYTLTDFGVTYKILSSSGTLDPEKLTRLLKYFAFGLYLPNIQREEGQT